VAEPCHQAPSTRDHVGKSGPHLLAVFARADFFPWPKPTGICDPLTQRRVVVLNRHGKEVSVPRRASAILASFLIFFERKGEFARTG